MACGELAADGDGFLGGGQGGLPLPGLGQPDAEVVQRAGQVGEVGVGVGLGELAADGGGFLGGGQGGLPLPGLGQPVAEVVQRAGQVGEVGVGVGLRRAGGGW